MEPLKTAKKRYLHMKTLFLILDVPRTYIYVVYELHHWPTVFIPKTKDVKDSQLKFLFATNENLFLQHICHWYILLPKRGIYIYMYTSNQWVRKVNETKKCGFCNAIVVLFFSMLAFVNYFLSFRSNPPQNVLGINHH